MPKRLTTKDFIERAQRVHGYRYDYSHVKYTTTSSKVTIICHRHGQFEQTANSHLCGIGCRECGYEQAAAKQRHTLADFVEKAREVHGDRYDYSQSHYVNKETKITVTCRRHGPFNQTPGNHLQGHGCSDCKYDTVRRALRSSLGEFVVKAKSKHGDWYDYSQAVYIDSKTPLTIICPEHGPFSQTPNSHLRPSGCPTCADIRSTTAQRHTLEDFIEKAQVAHGDRYDYSQAHYVNTNTPLAIICPEHGVFFQRPADHIKGSGCQQCGRRTCEDRWRKSTDTFIAEAIEVHGDLYGYSNVDYRSTDSKVTIVCRAHGEFYQTPHSHLRGQGCGVCGVIRRAASKRKTTAQFIADAVRVHGDRYDYRHAEYVSSDSAVIIVCKKHGAFAQVATDHLAAHGCPRCGVLARATVRTKQAMQFITDAIEKHGDRYDYSQVEYTNSKADVVIVCPDHGPFTQKPNNHLGGARCRKCFLDALAEAKRKTTEQFIADAVEVHGGLYDYSLVDYFDGDHKVDIVCESHGVFQQRPVDHLNRAGCPKCSSSRAERIIALLLDGAGVDYVEQHRFEDCCDKLPLPFDFYLPKQNLLIEYDGQQHFEPVAPWGGMDKLEVTQRHDAIKSRFAFDHGYRLIRILYTEFDQIEQLLQIALSP